jgi:hypothetical protein
MATESVEIPIGKAPPEPIPCVEAPTAPIESLLNEAVSDLMRWRNLARTVRDGSRDAQAEAMEGLLGYADDTLDKFAAQVSQIEAGTKPAQK